MNDCSMTEYTVVARHAEGTERTKFSDYAEAMLFAARIIDTEVTVYKVVKTIEIVN